MQAIIAWFPHETWAAMTMVLLASVFDLTLTLALVLVGRSGAPFQLKRLPRFLVTNVLPLVLGAIIGAIVVRAFPDFGVEYLTLIGAATAYLNRDVRDKLKQLIGIDPSGTVSVAPPSVTMTKRSS